MLNIDGSGKLRGEWYLTGNPPGATPIISTQKVTDGQWHHVVLSGATNTQTLYLDGVSVGTLAGTIDEQAHPYTYVGGGHGTPPAGWDWPPTPTTSTARSTKSPCTVARSPPTRSQRTTGPRQSPRTPASPLPSPSPTRKSTPARPATTPCAASACWPARTTPGPPPRTRTTRQATCTPSPTPNGHTTVTGHDARGNVVSTTTCRDADSCWTSFASYQLNASDPLDPRNDKILSASDQRSTDYKDTRYRTSCTYNAQGLPLSTVRADASTATTSYTTGSEAAVGGGNAPFGGARPGQGLTRRRKDLLSILCQRRPCRSDVPPLRASDLVHLRRTRPEDLGDSAPPHAFTEGITTSYTYDEASHVITESGPPGVKNEITGTTHTGQITRSYDEDGSLLSETAKDTTGGDSSRTIAYTYDTHGLNDSVTDAENNTTAYEHNTLGQVTRMTDPPAGTDYTYTYTPPRGQHATTVLMDWSGGPSGTVHDLTVESNAYDPAGRLASTTDAMGATTAYTYFDDGLPATTMARQVTQPTAADTTSSWNQPPTTRPET